MKAEWIGIAFLGATIVLGTTQIIRQSSELETIRVSLSALERASEISQQELARLQTNLAEMDFRLVAAREEMETLRASQRNPAYTWEAGKAKINAVGDIETGFYSLSVPLSFPGDSGEFQDAQMCDIQVLGY